MRLSRASRVIASLEGGPRDCDFEGRAHYTAPPTAPSTVPSISPGRWLVWGGGAQAPAPTPYWGINHPRDLPNRDFEKRERKTRDFRFRLFCPIPPDGANTLQVENRAKSREIAIVAIAFSTIGGGIKSAPQVYRGSRGIWGSTVLLSSLFASSTC